jgi:putative transposon-encoded protein
MAKVPVYDEGEVVARVEYNSNLDFWDGRNWTSGSTGRHLGYTRLKSGKFVLIHGTQWQGERASAEVVTPEEIVQAAARTGHLDDVYAAYPELKGTLEEEEIETPEPEQIEAEVVAFGNGAHATLPKDLLGRKIRYVVVDD